MTFSITVLGSSGTYPAPGHACSGYLLSTDTTDVWLDAGSGTLANLQRHIDLADLDGVVLSHEHPDHWIDLTIAVNALRYGIDRPDDGIPLYWTVGTARMFAAVSGRPTEPALVGAAIDETTAVTIGDIDFTFSRTDHPVETYAVRAEHDGRSVAYSADTGRAWEMTSLGGDRGLSIDLAVVEATLDDDDSGEFQHLRAADAGALAARAGARRLLVTHIPPSADRRQRVASAADAFGGPVELAEENVSFPI